MIAIARQVVENMKHGRNTTYSAWREQIPSGTPSSDGSRLMVREGRREKGPRAVLAEGWRWRETKTGRGRWHTSPVTRERVEVY